MGSTLLIELADEHSRMFQPEMAVLAAKCHTRQNIIHNSVKTYDILIK